MKNKLDSLTEAYHAQLKTLLELSNTPKRNVNQFVCYIRLAKIREAKKRVRRLEMLIEREKLEQTMIGLTN